MCQTIPVSDLCDKTFEYLEDHQAEDAGHLVSFADALELEQAWEHDGDIGTLETVDDVDFILESLLASKAFDETFLQAC